MIVQTNDPGSVRLFNSVLETAVRTLIVLDAREGRTCDLTRLVWLDYLVVHTGDVNGPPSLHPPLPYRSGELLVRRPTISDGLVLLRRLQLVEVVSDDKGVTYGTTDEAYPLIRLMQTAYAQELKERATWLADYTARSTDAELERVVTEALGQWNTEFSSSRDVGGGSG